MDDNGRIFSTDGFLTESKGFQFLRSWLKESLCAVVSSLTLIAVDYVAGFSSLLEECDLASVQWPNYLGVIWKQVAKKTCSSDILYDVINVLY